MPALPLRLATAALALSLVAAPTAAPGGDRCSIPGADRWREYRSAHVVLATDLSRERAAALVAELERLHALVLVALFGEGVDVPGRVRVVAFSSPRRFEDVAPAHAAAFVTTDRFGDPLVVFPYEGGAPVPEVVAHELAHRISWYHFPRQPRWFAEGLAGFVESVVRVQEQRTKALGSNIVRGVRGPVGRYAGLVSPRALDELRATSHASARELLEWRGRVDAGDPARLHVGSWVLYHWLWNHRSKQFTAFQEALAAGEAPEAAWRGAFPEWDPARPESLAALDVALASYRKEGRYAPYRVEAGALDARFAEALIAPADLHMLLLDLRAPERLGKDEQARRERVRREVDEALREDPSHPVATWERLHDPGDAAAAGREVAALRAVTAARPADWRGWLLLGGALDGATDAAEKEAALRRAVALEEGSARANNHLAWHLVSTGRPREARPFADRALDLAPWNPAIVDTLAAVAAGIGQCKAALALQRRAADLFPEAGDAGAGVRRRLAEYEAACGGPAPSR